MKSLDAIALVGLVLGASGTAHAQAPAPAPEIATTPLKDLLNDGYEIVSTSTNGMSAELVMIVNKDKRHFACVLSGVRADSYAQGKARVVAQPCVPLN